MNFTPYLILLIMHSIQVNCDPGCPFPSCTSVLHSNNNTCSIYCNSISLPERGDSNIISLTTFSLTGLKNLQADSFANFSIDYIIIDKSDLQSIDQNVFRNIINLNRIKFNSVNNIENIFNPNCFFYLQNITFGIEFSNFSQTLFSNLMDQTKTILSKINKISFSDGFSTNLKLNLTSLNNLIKIEFFSVQMESLSIILSLNLNDSLFSNCIIKNIYLDGTLNSYKLRSLTFKNISLEYIQLDSIKLLNNLNLMFNKLRSLSNISLAGSTVDFLSSLDLSYNLLTDIDSDYFKILNNLRDLKLDYNPLSNYKFNNLNLLDRLGLSYCNLSSLKGNFTLLHHLNLQGNLFKDVSFLNQTYSSKLQYLYLSNNLIENLDFPYLLPNLDTLNLNNNKLKLLKNSYFQNLPSLRELYLEFNLIESIEFPYLANLTYLVLNFNKITVLKNADFKNLPSLKSLYLTSNLIYQIESDTFKFLGRLEIIFLDNNYLSSFPSISDVNKLISFRNQNSNLTFLADYSFQRYITPNKSADFSLNIFLDKNNLTSVGSKLFCSKLSNPYFTLGFGLVMDDLNILNKCSLRQLTSARILLFSQKTPNCDLLLMAQKYSIYIYGPFNILYLLGAPLYSTSSLCKGYVLKDDCDTLVNQKYNCNFSLTDYNRTTTMVIGYSHIFSYKLNHQICSIGKNNICFKSEYITIFCSAKQTDPSYNATSIYDLGYSFTDSVKTFDYLDGSKTIYHELSNTHIILTKWIYDRTTYYNIYLRAPKYIYSKSSGLLVDSCGANRKKDLMI